MERRNPQVSACAAAVRADWHTLYPPAPADQDPSRPVRPAMTCPATLVRRCVHIISSCRFYPLNQPMTAVVVNVTVPSTVSGVFCIMSEALLPIRRGCSLIFS